MKILGLTGDIASGKSTVGRMLEARGAAYLDADLGVRELYSRPEFASLIGEKFGDVLDKNGCVNRGKLGALVFSRPVKLAELETIVHPAVAQLRREQLEELRAAGTQAVVVEAVKLLESGHGKDCDEIWCVVAWEDVQVERLMRTRNLTRDEAERRLGVQPSPEAKRALAGKVPLLFLSNNGDLADLEARVGTEWTRFLSN